MLSKELQKIYDEAVKVKTTILKKLEPLRLEEKKLQEKFDKIAKELREVREEIVSIEQPELAEASRTIAALGRRGKRAKTLKAESGDFGLKMT